MSIKVYFADNYKLGQYSGIFTDLLNKSDIFKKNGIDIVSTIKASNVVLANKTDCFFKYLKKPVIICERYDSTSIGSSYHYYSDPSVKAVFKNYIPRDKKMLLEETVKKRYHYSILSDIYNDLTIPKESVHQDTEKYIDKFRCVLWYLPYSHLDTNKHMRHIVSIRNTEKKDIDIFCIFHEHKDVLGTHRNKIGEIVKSKLGDRYNIVFGSNYDQNTYHSLLSRSKICIAPWGLGERIALDQKGLLAGCVLLKPDSDYVLTYPDLYQEKYYVKFKQDLSDIEDICVEVLTNLDKYRVRTEEANKLLEENDVDTMIKQICDNIKDVMSKK